MILVLNLGRVTLHQMNTAHLAVFNLATMTSQKHPELEVHVIKYILNGGPIG
jgi:hypothetical protein